MDFDPNAASHFLLKWVRITQNPELLPITVEQEQDGWVTFRYATGDRADCIDGTEKHNVLTRSEAVRMHETAAAVRASYDRASTLRESAKRLRDEEAAALHGGLLAQSRGDEPVPAVLAAVRDLALCVETLDQLASPLVIDVDCVFETGPNSIYGFRVESGGHLLATGRLTVMPLTGTGR